MKWPSPSWRTAKPSWRPGRLNVSVNPNLATELPISRSLSSESCQRIPEDAPGSSCQALDRRRAIRRSERGVKQLPGFGRCRQPRIAWPDLERVAQLGANVLQLGKVCGAQIFHALAGASEGCLELR